MCRISHDELTFIICVYQLFYFSSSPLYYEDHDCKLDAKLHPFFIRSFTVCQTMLLSTIQTIYTEFRIFIGKGVLLPHRKLLYFVSVLMIPTLLDLIVTEYACLS